MEINLKGLNRSLLRINKVFEHASPNGENIEESLVNQYEQFIEEANQNSPFLFKPFNKSDYFSHNNGYGIYYHSSGIKAHIANNLGAIETEAEKTSATSAVTEEVRFDFISNIKLQEILSRDYQDIQKNIIASSWKSAIILSGGSIEAILLDLLTLNENIAKSSSKAPPNKSDLDEWELNDLIEVAIETDLVKEPAIGKLSHSIREYRNLIHPGVELRKNLKVAAEEANIAFSVLKILIRNLS